MNSSDKAVQSILTQVSTLATELDELRATATDEGLNKRSQALNASIARLNEFKQKLDSLFERAQSEMDDLFCEYLWEKFHLPSSPRVSPCSMCPTP